MIIYRIKFGSHLYGTDHQDSDLDYKGLFLPDLEDLALYKYKNPPHHKTFSTSNSHTKNSNLDVDTQYWSLQYWLHLVSQGDTSALDLLFSYQRKDCIEVLDERLEIIFNNPLKLFNPLNTKAYIGYCLGQAKKYGIKGTRMGVLKNVVEFLNRLNSELDFNGMMVGDILSYIEKTFYHDSYCFIKVMNDKKHLVLNGKAHSEDIKIVELYNRLTTQYDEYGSRVKLALVNEGIDWKAVSHAVRCIEQVKELLSDGTITFPLKNKDLIKDIKLGILNWVEVSKLIEQGLDEIESLKYTTELTNKEDRYFVTSFIHSMYNLGGFHES